MTSMEREMLIQLGKFCLSNQFHFDIFINSSQQDTPTLISLIPLPKCLIATGINYSFKIHRYCLQRNLKMIIIAVTN